MSCPTGSHDTAAADAKIELSPTTTTITTTTTTATTTTPTTSTKPNSIRDAAAQSPEAYEDEHVHSVYESIAGHFSATRHKPWPFVASFLRERVAPGSVGLDVGCGNGKYLGVRGGGDVHIVGSDRSPSLARIARGRGRGRGFSVDVAVADGLALPFRRGCADFVLCIAVIHHLSTRERRVDALRNLLECVVVTGEGGGRGREPGQGQGQGQGQVLVYVWALEQSSSRRGWDVNSDQDQLVPWVTKANQNNNKKKKQDRGSGGGEGGAGGGGGEEEEEEEEEGVDATYERFYHLYREGELEEDMRAAGGRVIESGYEKDNWWVIGGHAAATS
ncbi:S-adenosyl-L-methionine-dependent methyltransferase [Xylaria acuta]|nr:S-adenosyl-L-methionine-dependent methyltransferase [Xylaria acuta]